MFCRLRGRWRCEVVAREYGRLSVPRKTSLNWTMPEIHEEQRGIVARHEDWNFAATLGCSAATNCRRNGRNLL